LIEGRGRKGWQTPARSKIRGPGEQLASLMKEKQERLQNQKTTESLGWKRCTLRTRGQKYIRIAAAHASASSKGGGINRSVGIDEGKRKRRSSFQKKVQRSSERRARYPCVG